MNDKKQMVIENGMKNNTNLKNEGDPCCLAENCQCILMDPQFTKIATEELFQKALQSETKEEALLLFSMAAYLRQDYLPALFHRALGLFDIGNYNLALMDIQRCRDFDLDNTLYERWEDLLNGLVHTANEPDC